MKIKSKQTYGNPNVPDLILSDRPDQLGQPDLTLSDTCKKQANRCIGNLNAPHLILSDRPDSFRSGNPI